MPVATTMFYKDMVRDLPSCRALRTRLMMISGAVATHLDRSLRGRCGHRCLVVQLGSAGIVANDAPGENYRGGLAC